MTAIWKALPACLGLLLLAACQVTTAREIVEARSGYTSAMGTAARHIQEQDWDGAREAIMAARASLPFDEANAAEDGNYAYLALQAKAAEAYVTLASGDVEGAELMYDALFREVGAFEQNREEAFRKRVDSARLWEAFGTALFSVASSRQQDLDTGMTLMLAFRDFAMPLDAPGPPPIDTAHLDSLGIDYDGVRMTVLPTIGPLSRIARLVSEGGSCTASLVGNRLALTNAHCVTSFDQEGDTGIPKGEWSILQGDIRLVFDGLYAPDQVRVTGVTFNGGDRWIVAQDNDFSDDWAILNLDRHPVGRGWFGVAETAPLESEHVFVPGHSGDLNDGRFITVQWNCYGYATEEEPIFHHVCKTSSGSSGSPILMSSGPLKLDYIVGLNAFGPVDETDDNAGPRGGPSVEQFRNAIGLAAAGGS